MADNTLYIDRPGGVILHHKSGEGVSYDYGQQVDLDDLSEAQKNHIHRFTSTERPDDSPPPPGDTALDSAMITAGQPNSTASPVPGNYNELTDEQAVRLVRSMRDPRRQAVVVAHEMANKNRRKVVAAASQDAVEEANIRRIVTEHEEKQSTEAPRADLSQTQKASPAKKESSPSKTKKESSSEGSTPPPSSG